MLAVHIIIVNGYIIIVNEDQFHHCTFSSVEGSSFIFLNTDWSASIHYTGIQGVECTFKHRGDTSIQILYSRIYGIGVL